MAKLAMLVRVVASVITGSKAAFVAAFGPAGLASKHMRIQSGLAWLAVTVTCVVFAFWQSQVWAWCALLGLFSLVITVVQLRHVKGYYRAFAAEWELRRASLVCTIGPIRQRYYNTRWILAGGWNGWAEAVVMLRIFSPQPYGYVTKQQYLVGMENRTARYQSAMQDPWFHVFTTVLVFTINHGARLAVAAVAALVLLATAQDSPELYMRAADTVGIATVLGAIVWVFVEEVAIKRSRKIGITR